MSDDDKMFDYVLARSRTRECSTLTVATVAASAALVLVVLYAQVQVDIELNIDHPSRFSSVKYWIAGFGIAFAGLGIPYRIVTKHVIHDNDDTWLREYVKKWRINNHGIGECIIGRSGVKDPLGECKDDESREVIIYALLGIPIVTWIVTLIAQL